MDFRRIIVWFFHTVASFWSTVVIPSSGSGASAPRGILGHCVTWTWMSVRTHLACTRGSVSTHVAASNASVAPDTQVAFFFFTLQWREDQYESLRKLIVARWLQVTEATLMQIWAPSKKINKWMKAPPHNGRLLISLPASGRYRAGFSVGANKRQIHVTCLIGWKHLRER